MPVRILLLTTIFLFFISTPVLAVEQTAPQDIKAAFIRDGNLWIYENQEEVQITKEGDVFAPQWSHDGQWLLYQKNAEAESEDNKKTHTEIWVFHVQTGEKKKIFYNGRNPKWSSEKNLVAFQSDEVLNISDLDRFYNIELGVNSYQWLPDGSGFLLSSQADLLPDGWTSPILYKKIINMPLRDVRLHKNVHRLLKIPKEVEIGETSILSIGAGHFSFSPSGKWISFIISPTASWSMDSNMVSVMRNDGSTFKVLDEVILGVGKPKWAPDKDRLAYIAGGGRIVLGFKDKDLKIKEMPVNQSFTPDDYAELDFSWIDNNSLVTSRVEEREWSNEPGRHPLPKLYRINITDKQQEAITEPPEYLGDYNPMYLDSKQMFVWFRGSSLTDTDKNVWVADHDGKNHKKWLENVENLTLYTE
ncbi:hypothetical protein [Virgibacillus sp. MSP4-1]|uniref:hypothetical protein n=1 Tax=Virgibacillus sp. MSP4-1 TaxID=2700081 RepID=UPI0003A1296F|nr:hypothetical protein [Virgibacillus sp. MSP4-1]